MSKPKKQTAAQRDAKRLYKRFYKAFRDYYLMDGLRCRLAKKGARLAAIEARRRALVWADRFEHDNIKDYFNQVRKAIEEM